MIRRPNGADNLRRSDSIRNNCRSDQRSLNYRGAKRGIAAASAAGFCARTRPPGTEFLDAETGPQISPPKWVSARRDKIREMSGRKSPQKRPIWRCAGNTRFSRTGWWCAQSDTNPSPCYLAKNRVIFEKNSEKIIENTKRRLKPGTSRFFE